MSTTTTESLEVVIRDTVSVRVKPGFDAELLRAVVAALETKTPTLQSRIGLPPRKNVPAPPAA